jgi:hypothetical protein
MSAVQGAQVLRLVLGHRTAATGAAGNPELRVVPRAAERFVRKKGAQGTYSFLRNMVL